MSGVEEVRGEKAVIRFDGARCVHSRQCVLVLPQVFRANVEGPWIHPDAASPEALSALAARCPSGAITVERLDGGPQEAPPAVNLATVRENGPLALVGDLAIGGDSRVRATLCRCGASASKPYCDGSHNAAGFVASGEPPTQASEPLAARDGRLAIDPIPNGPLKVSGNLELTSGTGRTLDRKTVTFFCRCGQSANKPYCDGTHRKVGFVAP
jgi:CDGSH-type Zn-finger protein/uncharacterized Fe-S cluster protein YjdI